MRSLFSRSRVAAAGLLSAALVSVGGCSDAGVATPVIHEPTETVHEATAPAGTPTSQETPGGGTSMGMFTPELRAAVDAASAHPSRTHGIPKDEIEFASSEGVDWPDTSLGNPQPGMMYAQVVTPGWRLFLDARGQRYQYHTNRDGTAVTLVGSAPTPGGAPKVK